MVETSGKGGVGATHSGMRGARGVAGEFSDIGSDFARANFGFGRWFDLEIDINNVGLTVF